MTVADGTEFAPGDAFTKTWRISNTGTCSWSSNYYITFVSGSAMEGSDTAIDELVAPGRIADVSVSLTAPDDEGTYRGYWSMANNSGTLFGQRVYVRDRGCGGRGDQHAHADIHGNLHARAQHADADAHSIPDTATTTPTATSSCDN